MKRQQGFTLIELVVVIVILGILATTAIPKFVNLQSDARVSTLNGLKGAIAGANNLIYSKALVKGVQKSAAATNVDIGNGVNVSTIYGYMLATNTALAAGVDITLQAASVSNPTADWLYTNTSGTPARIVIRQNGAPASNCYLTYTQADATNLPKISIKTEGC
ncbi:MAG: type II secretion system protein [Shewanella sp.]|nr:type II secretion system protein [Shewanella sp.]